MQQFLGLLFLLRILWWFVATILKCFGLIKDAEPEHPPQQPGVPQQNQGQPHQQLSEEQIYQSILNNNQNNNFKNRPMTNSNFQQQYQQPQQPQFQGNLNHQSYDENVRYPSKKPYQAKADQTGPLKPGQIVYLKKPKLTAEQKAKIKYTDAETQTGFDLTDLQQKINALEELTRKTILQELAYKKQFSTGSKEDMLNNQLLQTMYEKQAQEELKKQQQQANRNVRKRK